MNVKEKDFEVLLIEDLSFFKVMYCVVDSVVVVKLCCVVRVGLIYVCFVVIKVVKQIVFDFRVMKFLVLVVVCMDMLVYFGELEIIIVL